MRGKQKDRRMNENECPMGPTMLLPAPPVNASEWGTSAPLSMRGNKLKGHPPDDGGDGLKTADRAPTWPAPHTGCLPLPPQGNRQGTAVLSANTKGGCSPTMSHTQRPSPRLLKNLSKATLRRPARGPGSAWKLQPCSTDVPGPRGSRAAQMARSLPEGSHSAPVT